MSVVVGVVAIFSAWNYPVSLLLTPAAGAIAAVPLPDHLLISPYLIIKNFIYFITEDASDETFGVYENHKLSGKMPTSCSDSVLIGATHSFHLFFGNSLAEVLLT